MAYQALFWRVELGGVSLQVRVLLVRGGEEERRILARRDTATHIRSVSVVVPLRKKGKETDSNTSMPTSG